MGDAREHALLVPPSTRKERCPRIGRVAVRLRLLAAWLRRLSLSCQVARRVDGTTDT